MMIDAKYKKSQVLISNFNNHFEKKKLSKEKTRIPYVRILEVQDIALFSINLSKDCWTFEIESNFFSYPSCM